VVELGYCVVFYYYFFVNDGYLVVEGFYFVECVVV